MEKKVGIFEAKTKLSELCGKVAESGIEYVITRRGIPIARIVAPDRGKTEQPLTTMPIGEALEQWNASHPEDRTKKRGDFPDVWLERRGAKSSPFDDEMESAPK